MPINPSDIKIQQIRKWLDYALVQVAAERYWHLDLEPEEIVLCSHSPVPPEAGSYQ